MTIKFTVFTKKEKIAGKTAGKQEKMLKNPYKNGGCLYPLFGTALGLCAYRT